MSRPFSRIALLASVSSAVAALVLAGCGRQSAAADCGQLADSDAWVRQAPAGAQVMAGYFTLTNKGGRAVTVNAVNSTQFANADMHQTVEDNGQASMKPLAEITVEAGQTLRFKPGGRHVMLMSPSQPYGAGDQVEMVLSCGSQHAELPVVAVVRADQPSLPTEPDTDDDSRAQVLQDGKTGGGADAADDSRTAGTGH